MDVSLLFDRCVRCVILLAGICARLRSLRSNNRGEPDHDARACCAARCTPQALRRRRSLKGVEKLFEPSLRSAPEQPRPSATIGCIGFTTPLAVLK